MGCSKVPSTCFSYESGKFFAVSCQNPERKEEFGTAAHFEQRLWYSNADLKPIEEVQAVGEDLQAAQWALDQAVKEGRLDRTRAQELIQKAKINGIWALQRFRLSAILDSQYLTPNQLGFCQKYLWCEKPLPNSLAEAIDTVLTQIRQGGFNMIPLADCTDFEFGSTRIQVAGAPYWCNTVPLQHLDPLKTQNQFETWREIAARGIPFRLHYDPVQQAMHILNSDDNLVAYWRANHEIQSRQFEEQNPTRRNLSLTQLEESSIADENVGVIWVDFFSARGYKYSAGHIFDHPSGPYIALEGGNPKDEADFRAVEKALAKIYGGRLEEGRIDHREDHLFSANIRVRAFSQQRIARVVEHEFSKSFRYARIATVHYQNIIPKLASLLP